MNQYKKPGKTTLLLNRVVAALTRRGVSVWGARVLFVRGRRSGAWRSTPVNPLTWDGERYLVAARGTTEWARNLRSAGEGQLRLGRRVETFTATELPDAEKVPVLRAYLARWKFEVGTFFEGVDPKDPDERFRSVAAAYPVFRIRATGNGGPA